MECIKRVEPGTEIYNELENVHYVTNADKCIVLTGTVGEQWPVTEAKLEKTYDVKNLLDRINSGEKVEAHPLPTADKIYAERADKETQVQTSWGDVLTAHEGDIIAYKVNGDGSVDRNDSWVINKDIFRTTYENAENKLVEKVKTMCENLKDVENKIIEERQEIEHLTEQYESK